MKYFFDTEFLEGRQNKPFGGKTKATIDLISIGIVSEDGREYYAISKDFNLKEAWSRYDQKTEEGDRNNLHPRKYWLRDNVLHPIYLQLLAKYRAEVNDLHSHRVVYAIHDLTDFNYKNLKWLIKHYGRYNNEIANDICAFVYGDDCGGSGMSAIEMAMKYEISDKSKEPEFYAYFADYDWVVFCWLFGNMMSLPKGFPMYCRDLKQMLDEKVEELSDHASLFDQHYREKGHDIIPSFKEKLDLVKRDGLYPKNGNEHDALADAKWNFELYKYIKFLSK